MTTLMLSKMDQYMSTAEPDVETYLATK